MATITSHYKQVKGNQRHRQTKKLDSTTTTLNSDSRNIPDENASQILRDFDMEGKYGPCIGITRMERWERAEKFGLSPPKVVKEIIACNSGKDDINLSIWHKYDI